MFKQTLAGVVIAALCVSGLASAAYAVETPPGERTSATPSSDPTSSGSPVTPGSQTNVSVDPSASATPEVSATTDAPAPSDSSTITKDSTAEPQAPGQGRGAAPFATTAPGLRPTAGNRLVGPWLTGFNLQVTQGSWARPLVQGQQLEILRQQPNSQTPDFSFPGLEDTGPITGTGLLSALCVTRASDANNAVLTAELCTGAANQDWKLTRYVHQAATQNIWTLSIPNSLSDGIGWHTITTSSPVYRGWVYLGSKQELSSLNLNFLTANAGMTAQVRSVDSTAKTAVVGGTAVPGSEVRLEYPAGTFTKAAVDAAGNWSTTVRNLKSGANTIIAAQFVGGVQSGSTVSLTATVVDTPLTAQVKVVNVGARTAVLGGTGVAGSQISVVTDNGTLSTQVATDGTWELNVSGLKLGVNSFSVTQNNAGVITGPVPLSLNLAAPSLTALLKSQDNLAKSAVLGGTGQPGATITVKTPAGEKTTTVDGSGNWQYTVTGLPNGSTALPVTQTVNGTVSPAINVNVTILAAAENFTVALQSQDDAAKSAIVGGTGEPGALINVGATGANTAQAIVGTDGKWTTSITGLSVGGNVLTVTQTVGSTESTPKYVQVNIKAVAAPFTAMLKSQDNTAKSATLGGIGEVGAQISIITPSGVKTTVVDASGNWEFVATGLPNGPTTFPITQTINGVVSAPLSVSVTMLAVADNFTLVLQSQNNAAKTAVVGGTGEPGATITASVGATKFTATVTADGSWSTTVTGLVVGGNIVTAAQTVPSGTSADKYVMVNLSAVVAPLTATLTSQDDTKKTATLSGTGEPNATITVKTPAGDKTTTVAANGSWEYTVTGLPNGTTTLEVTQTVAGVVSAPVSVPVTIRASVENFTASLQSQDNAAKSAVIGGTGEPGATITLESTDGSTVTATVAADGMWSATVAGLRVGPNVIPVTQTIGGTVSGEKNVRVTIVETIATLTASVLSQDNTAKSAVLGGTGQPGATITVKNAAGDKTTTVDASGTWQLPVSGLPNGTTTYMVTQTVAGAESTPIPVNVTILAQVSNFTASLQSQNDAQKSAVIGGTGEPGATITLEKIDGSKVTATVAADGTWSSSVADLRVGLNLIPATQTIGSEVSAEKVVRVTIVETVVPLSAKLLNVNNSDRWANITVTATPGATITATSPNGTKATAVVPASGKVVVRALDLNVGANDILVTQNVAGMESAPVVVKATIAKQTAAVTAELVSQDDTAKTALIGGTGEPGATITLKGAGADVTATVGADGTWTATVTGLKNGKNTVAVTQTFAGKTTGPVSVVIDIKAVAENFTAKLDSQNDDAKSAVISGTGEPGATITVSPTTGTKTVTVAANGTWKITVTGLKVGLNNVSVTQTVGTTVSAAKTVPVTIIETVVPLSAKLLNVNNPDRWANITVTATPGATITATSPNGTKATAVVPASGKVVVRALDLNVGANDILVTQNVAGVESAPVVVKATIAKQTDPVTATLKSQDNVAKTAVLEGTGEPGATITIKGAGPQVTATVKPDGTWTATVTGLKLGANTAQVTQTFAGKTTGPVAVDILIETVVGNFTAKVESWDDAAKTAVIGGTGEPGATITLSPISGDVTVKVSANGTWKTTVTGLVVGPNIVPVTQTIGNEVSAPKNVTVNILANLAPLTVEVGTVDNAGRWANLTGTGQPGAQIIATVAGGASFTTQVAANGTWSTRVLGLEVGTNSVSVTQSADGVTSNPVTVAIRITEEVDSFTANLVGQDDSKRTAVIAGTGVIGATITLNTPSGNQTVEVDAEGNWQYTVTGLSIGNNPILVSQTVNGKPAGQKVVTVNIAAVTVPLTADVKDINDAKRTATIFGTGKPGATITLSLFGKDVTTTVAANGTWSREIGGLVIGSQSVAVTQKVDGELVGSTFVLVGVGVTIKDLTAKLVNVNNRERWANIGGTGQPGAVIIATNLNGTQFTATVANNGRWTMRVLDLNVGPNTIAVHQSYLGNVSPTINLSAAIAIWIAKPTIRVISQDDLAKTAVVGGTGEPGGIITVTFEGRKYTATVQEDGTWTRELTNLKRGANAVSAIQVIYGNTSDPVATTITLKAMLEDFTAKAAAANDAARTVEVSGTGVPGATIHLRPGSANATTTVVDAAGNWKATVSNLIVGENIIPVHQELDGKMSAPKNLYVSVVSTNRPLTGTATLNNAARSAALAGTATPGSVISVVLSNGTKLSTTTTAAGNWNTSATNLPLGVTVFSVTQTVGTETLNDGITLQVEVKATVGKLTAKISSTTSATGTVNVTGTGTAGATVTVSGPAGDKTVVVPANGNWSLDYSGLPDEASTLVAIQRLEGAESNTVDLSAFIIPPVTSAKVDRIASMAGTVYFSGTGIPGYAVRVTLGDKTIGSIVGADGTWTRQFNDVPMGTNDFTIVQAKGTDISRATALPVELTIPTIPFTAKLWQYSNSTLQARYTGTATPGSVITVTTEDGTKNTTTVPMTATGAWNFWATSGYKSGKNTVTITETTADGVESAPIYSTVTFP